MGHPDILKPEKGKFYVKRFEIIQINDFSILMRLDFQKCLIESISHNISTLTFLAPLRFLSLLT